MVSFTFFSLLVSTQLALVLAAPTTPTFPANGKFDYQIGAPYTPAAGVKVVERDHSQSPAAGLFNICYLNAFQTQPEEKSFWTSSPNKDLLLLTKAGALFEDKDWKGEYFLDTTTDAKRQRIATILNGWIDQCADKGFNAIEPDNLDTFTRSKGLLTADNNLALAKLFTDHAHSRGLLVAQKNTGGELGSKGKAQAGFDFAVAEECNEYDECGSYTDVYGAKVIEIEYTDADDASANFKAACKARGSSISVILRDRQVVASSAKAYHYEEC
ncbi:glycoside hydrolase family 114 protein [Roridomyces roridus]|uniref:alpha-galactosidase n=1 Tax=Roridomyces roridus TaxID=1738132 RepID=A0AAD7FJY6_9AGAR|nr:glycoside hydrolase family 114 protein [Roridomyces roridus]